MGSPPWTTSPSKTVRCPGQWRSVHFHTSTACTPKRVWSTCSCVTLWMTVGMDRMRRDVVSASFVLLRVTFGYEKQVLRYYQQRYNDTNNSCLTAPELQCNFEQGLCSWKQEKSGVDVFDWTRIQGPTPSFNTGPWRDHTLGTSYGHYLYIESSFPQKFKDTAVLLSRVFQPTIQWGKSRHHCVFRFHYHMFGSHVFCLAVYLRTTSTGRGHMLWVRYGDQGNLWHRKTLYLNSARPFQVTKPRLYQ